MTTKVPKMITIPCGGRPRKEQPNLEILRMQREIMTIKQLAEYYGVSRRTVYRWLGGDYDGK
jgi:DNA invertase Pin-like site-specific DNA recombinase